MGRSISQFGCVLLAAAGDNAELEEHAEDVFTEPPGDYLDGLGGVDGVDGVDVNAGPFGVDARGGSAHKLTYLGGIWSSSLTRFLDEPAFAADLHGALGWDTEPVLTSITRDGDPGGHLHECLTHGARRHRMTRSQESMYPTAARCRTC